MTTRAGLNGATGALDAAALRREFSILERTFRVGGQERPVVYLDSAATSQKPRAVIEAVSRYYERHNANIHRGVYQLSMEATEQYEQARRKAAQFVNAARPEEIVFTRGTTEAINLVAQAWGRANLRAGDEVLITGLEHHSNIVPWQMLCEQTGAVLKVAPINERGEVVLEAFERLITGRTKVAAFAHVSNALGTVLPVEQMAAMVRQGAPRAIVLIDGAQAVPHAAVDVRAIGCDFYAFSGHKMYGPTGIGALYGRYELLEAMPPYQGGGDMILSVTFERTTYAKPPARFEAGTPNIAGAVGLGAAVDFLNKIGLERIATHEADLLAYGTARLSEAPGVRLIGTAERKAGVLSFTVDGVHPHDLGTIVDQRGVAIRTGHHCAQPVMDFFQVPATARASLGLYNTREDIDALIDALAFAREVFA